MLTGHAFLVIVAATIGGLAATPPQAQDYPNKPVRLVVPSAAGSPADHIARWLGDRLAPVLGQSIKAEYDKWGAVIREAKIKID